MPSINGNAARVKRHAIFERLAGLAKTWGAEDACVIETDGIIVDPRVRLKCMIPKCYMSGGCAHCPPYGYSAEETLKRVRAFENGVFFHVKVRKDIIAAKGLSDSLNRGIIDDKGCMLNLGAHYMLVFAIVARLRKEARERGFSETLGFAAGNCKDVLCFVHPVCRKLTRSGKCRNPDLSVPSLESAGMDAYQMAAEVGWEVYPIGGSCTPESVPHGILMGLLLAK